MKLLCLILGHKPKKAPSLFYWVEGVGAVPSLGPYFCERCKAGEIEMGLKIIATH